MLMAVPLRESVLLSTTAALVSPGTEEAVIVRLPAARMLAPFSAVAIVEVCGRAENVAVWLPESSNSPPEDPWAIVCPSNVAADPPAERVTTVPKCTSLDPRESVEAVSVMPPAVSNVTSGCLDVAADTKETSIVELPTTMSEDPALSWTPEIVVVTSATLKDCVSRPAGSAVSEAPPEGSLDGE
jgi:hypothetical protein